MKTVLCFHAGPHLSGIKRYAKAAGWRLQIVPYGELALLHRIGTVYPRKPDIQKLLSFWKPDGVIVEGDTNKAPLNPKDFGKTPVVFFDRDLGPGTFSVYSDHAAVAEMAALELTAHNLASYGFVPWFTPQGESIGRQQAFLEKMREKHLPCRVFRRRSAHGDDEAYRGALEKWIRGAPKPFGVFAVNDPVASTVLICAARAKIRVPEEVMVIGVDDDVKICETTTPTLTSISPGREQGGFLAAEMLDRRLADPRLEPYSVRFPPESISHRVSTFTYRRREACVQEAMELIRNEACNGLSAREVAAHMDIGRRMFDKRFREVTGHTPLEEIRHVRIDHAKSMLLERDFSVDKIATSCGYRSVRAFRKAFIVRKLVRFTTKVNGPCRCVEMPDEADAEVRVFSHSRKARKARKPLEW